MQYTTWEFYRSLYDIVTEDDFDRLCTKASIKLDAVTHMRTNKFEKAHDEETATDFQRQVHMQIQTTACELINAIYTQDAGGMGSGVSSVSNDGYSETYKITTVAEKETQLRDIVRQGLSGTGLVGAL